jgi:hypothetical protein
LSWRAEAGEDGVMVKARKRSKSPKLGRQDRWPSDYGIRDRERNSSEKRNTSENRAAKQDGSWAPGEKGQGREGRSKGYSGSAGEGPSGPERKKS